MTQADLLRLRTGTAEPEPLLRVLVAGPLSAEFSAGNLRAIRYDGHEVLRAIAYLVRDEDWGTYQPRLDDLAVEEGADRFDVRYRAVCTGRSGAVLTVAVRIEGTADGTLVFDAVATTDRPFATNRCGFNILHPIVGVAGTPVTVEHVDGSVEHAVFPDLIDPAQPFLSMRAITHRVTEGLSATTRMEGDTFEMEDQRNWTDASYKTYVRPLALPWPYTVEPNAPNRQTITLTVRRDTARSAANAVRPAPGDTGTAAVSISLGAVDGTVPAIGLVLTPEEAAATRAHADLLQAIAPQHLLLHFDPSAGHDGAAAAALKRAVGDGGAMLTLECVVPCRGDLDAELGAVAAWVREAGLALSAVVVSPAVDLKSTPPGSRWPDCPPLADVYAAARRAFPGLRLGGGMISTFTELNRKRPPVDRLDFVTHTTVAIVHAADDRSVMETLEALPFVTRSTRAFIGSAPYRIGPSTIGMRQNPYGSRTADNPARRRLTMAKADPRQDGLFAAAWAIGYAAATADAGLEGLTLSALTGPFGLVVEAGATPTPSVRPVYHAVRALAAFGGAPRLKVVSAAPGRVAAVGAETAEGRAVVLANLTPEPAVVALDPALGPVAVIDETTVEIWRTGALPAPHPHDGTVAIGPYGLGLAGPGMLRP